MREAVPGHPHHHRGAHSQDERLFGPQAVPGLRAATADLSWLLSRGYALASALTLVGNRHVLHERQRRAVQRAACSEAGLLRRAAARPAPELVRGQDVLVDGFNLLITAEAALGGGVLLRCRDGCLRDLSSVHGSYRAVQETEAALGILGGLLQGLAPRSVTWLFDRPVSNSGRLAQSVAAAAEAAGWPWQVEAVFSPDHALIASDKIAVTSDSNVLDGVARWVNLSDFLLAAVPAAWVVDLSGLDNGGGGVVT